MDKVSMKSKSAHAATKFARHHADWLDAGFDLVIHTLAGGAGAEVEDRPDWRLHPLDIAKLRALRRQAREIIERAQIQRNPAKIQKLHLVKA